MGKTVMVTGAGGFLGRNLVTKLMSCGHSVYAVTSKGEAELGVSGLSAVVGNRDFEAIGALLDGTDVLFNCAFPRNVDGYQLAEGMDYLQRLFEIAGKSRVGAVVNISSQSVYSQTRTEPAREDAPVCLESKYAVAKYASEQLLDAYCKEVPHTNIRLASLIGPGFDQRVVNKMADHALTCGLIEVMDNGSRFGFLDVDDAADGLTKMCSQMSVSLLEPVYNLGTDGAFALSDLASEVVRAFSRRGREVGIAYSESQQGTPLNTSLDASLFSHAFSWKSSRTIQASVAKIVDSIWSEC